MGTQADKTDATATRKDLASTFTAGALKNTAFHTAQVGLPQRITYSEVCREQKAWKSLLQVNVPEGS